ncbi:MAG: YHYH protein [Actinomycetota bacterium]
MGRLAALGLGVAALLAGCTSDDAGDDATPDRLGSEAVDGQPGIVEGDSTVSEVATSAYLDGYALTTDDFAGEVVVTIAGERRLIETNALPNHETGPFPNDGNPNAIAAQNLAFDFPTTPEFTGSSTQTRLIGVAVNGVPFDPATAERVTCASGPIFVVEAIQNRFDLGLDLNNAHVQPDGTYHYHGRSQVLIESLDDGGDTDLVHIGFAADGHLIYASRSGRYAPSYRLTEALRQGVDCTYRDQAVEIEGTAPDGTYTSDWEFDSTVGDLDRCNGTTIDDEYLYVVTDGFPFLPRCLNGAFTPTGPQPGGGAGPGGDGDGGGGGDSSDADQGDGDVGADRDDVVDPPTTEPAEPAADDPAADPATGADGDPATDAGDQPPAGG